VIETGVNLVLHQQENVLSDIKYVGNGAGHFIKIFQI